MVDTGYSPVKEQNTVTFNGLAAGIVSATPTQVVVSIPGGPSSGPLYVATPMGSATSSQSFTAGACGTGGLSAPTIASFNPVMGSAGTVVNIQGSNFDPDLANDKVTFNGNYAAPTGATTTTLTTSVSSTATCGPISVMTPAGTAVSSGYFYVPPSPHTPADVQVTGELYAGTGYPFTISTAYKIALLVFEGALDQRISLKLSNISLDDTTVAVRKPDGTILAFVQNNFLDTQTLPATGTYTVSVVPNSLDTGNMTVTLYNVPADVAGSLTLNNPAALSVPTSTPGQNAALTFSGAAGQKATVKITNNTMQSNGGVVVTLIDPNGAVLTSKTSTNGSFNLDQKSLVTTGTYTVFIDPKQANTGSLGVRVTNP